MGYSLVSKMGFSSVFLEEQNLLSAQEIKAEKTAALKKELRNSYGDRYDLSLVLFENTRTPIKLICPEHGVFEQHHRTHHKKGGCQKCKSECRKNELISKFRAIHGDFYDYSEMQFSRYKVAVKCPKHERFWVTIISHATSLGAGCPRCSQEKQNGKLLEIFKQVHGERYDYSEMKFIKNSIKVSIICRVHGRFEQLPLAHKVGQGCPVCAGRQQK